MKRILVFGMLAVFALASVSCGPSKRTTSVTKGEKEVNLIFNGPEYRSDKKYFRDNGFGVSNDMANAKKIAMQNARQAIASMVHSTVKMLVDNYAVTQSADGSEYYDGNDLEVLGRTVVETQLSGLEVMEEKAFRQNDGTFRYHVCMQLSKDNLSKAMSNAIDEDAKTKLRVDKEAFKKYFDEKIR